MKFSNQSATIELREYSIGGARREAEAHEAAYLGEVSGLDADEELMAGGGGVLTDDQSHLGGRGLGAADGHKCVKCDLPARIADVSR